METYETTQIMDFSSYIAEHARHFTGRQWVFSEINRWLASAEGSRYLIITGEPGIGKTAIAAQLTQLCDLAAAHFCIARQNDTIDPLNFVRSLSHQLMRFDGFAQAITEEQGTYISGQASSEQNSGSVIGVYINTLVVKASSPVVAFNRIVADPLRRFCAGRSIRQLVILIDALDEAVQLQGAETILDLLANQQNLPPQVRFLLTTRPDDQVLRNFEKAQVLLLNAEADENIRDLRTYIHQQVEMSQPLQKQLKTHGIDPQTLIDRAIIASQGNFLYLAFLLPAIATSNHPLQVTNTLPEGLDGIYRELLRLRIGKNLSSWRTSYRPLLGVLATAQAPLTQDQLVQFTRLREQEVEDVLQDLQEFLDPAYAREEQYLLYHQSIADFLRVKKQAMEFHINLTPVHEMIVNFYRGFALTWEEVKWDETDDYGLRYLPSHLYALSDSEAYRQGLYTLLCRPYMEQKNLRYGSHQLFAEDVLLAIKVAGSENPPDVIQEARGSLLYATLGSLSTNVPPVALGVLAQEGQLSKAQGLAALMQDPLNQSRAYQLIGEALLEQNKVQEAQSILTRAAAAATIISDLHERFSTPLRLAPIQVRAEQKEQALASVWQARALIGKTGAGWLDKQRMLVDIVQSLADIGELNEAMQLVELITVADLRALALGKIVLPLLQKEGRGRAVAIVQTMLTLSTNIDYLPLKATVLSQVILALTQMEEHGWIKKMADQMLALAEEVVSEKNIVDEKALALSRIGEALAQIGEKEYLFTLGNRIVAAAKEVESDEARLQVLIRIAHVLRDVGEIEQAVAITKQVLSEFEVVKDEKNKVLLLCSVALLLHQTGEAGAVDVLMQAADLGRGMSEEDWIAYLKWSALQEVAETFASIGQFERARATVEIIAKLEIKATALGEIAGILARSNARELALATANEAVAIATAIKHTHFKASALTSIAQTLASAGSAEKAKDVAKQAIQEAGGIEDEYRRVKSLEDLTQAGFVEQAVKALETIDNGRGMSLVKESTLRNVVATLSRQGRQEQAMLLVNKMLAMAEGQRERGWLQAKASIAFTQIGHDDLALELVEKINNVGAKTKALKEIAPILYYEGKKELANEVIRVLITLVDGLEDLRDKVTEWLAIVPLLTLTGEEERASELIDYALAAAKEVRYFRDEHYEGIALDNVALVLAERGQFDKALEVAAQISERSQQATTFRKIAVVLAQAGEFARAVAVVCRGLTSAIEGEGENDEEKEDAIFEQSIIGLAKIANVLVQGGEHAYADALVDVALQLSKQAPSPELEVIGIVTSVGILEEKQQFKDVLIRTLERVASFEDMDSRLRQLENLIELLSPLGEQERALVETYNAQQAVKEISEIDAKALALVKLAQCFSHLDEQKQVLALASSALELAEKLSSTFQKIRVLREVAGILAQSEEKERAITLAYQIARITNDSWDRAHLVDILAVLGQHDKAIEMAERIEKASVRAYAFLDIARTLASETTGDVAADVVAFALKAIEEAGPEPHQAAKLMRVARILSQIGRYQQAVEITSTINDSVWKVRALTAVASCAFTAGNRVIALELAEQALITAELATVNKDRVKVLEDIASLLRQLGEKDRAMALAIQALALGAKYKKQAVEALCDVAQVLMLAQKYPIVRILANQMASMTRGIEGTTHLRASLFEKIAQILIQIAGFEQVEQVMDWMEEVKNKNAVLEGLVPLLMQAGMQEQALRVLGKAFADSRAAGRNEVYEVLQVSISALETADQGQELWRLYEASQEIEDWWAPLAKTPSSYN